MNAKYIAIIAGIVLLIGAGLMLVKKQYKNNFVQNNSGQSATQQTDESAAVPTQPATGVLQNAGNQITLAVNQPANGSSVNSPQIMVSGKTVPDADVSINDQDITADAKGNFSTALTLDEGENTVIVVASDADGNSSEQDINVTYNVPDTQ